MIEMIIRLYHEGYTDTQIAMLVGCSVQDVDAVLRECRIRVRAA